MILEIILFFKTEFTFKIYLSVLLIFVLSKHTRKITQLVSKSKKVALKSSIINPIFKSTVYFNLSFKQGKL